MILNLFKRWVQVFSVSLAPGKVAQTLWRFAETAQREGRIARAVSLYWATKSVFDSIGTWTVEDNKDFGNYLAACRAAMMESEFTTTVENGRAMTMEQAIAYALENQS